MVNGFATSIAAIDSQPEQMLQGSQGGEAAALHSLLFGSKRILTSPKAVFYLQASAEQGNMYAQILLEHMGSFHNPSAFLAATRLLHRLEKLFREDYRKGTGGVSYHIDRKRRRKLAEKKQAQGHKRDDHEPVQQVY